MNYIFFGTPSFSARCLKILLDHDMAPVAVICNPDRPVGRKHVITPPPVKQLIANRESRIAIFQPEKLDVEFQTKLKALNPDFFVVFAYNKILRKEVLNIPRLGTIGVHPSFLPKYRGPSPFQTALLNGETETGVTLYLLDVGVDSGPILAQSKPVAIRNTDTFHSLAEKLADIGGDMLVETLASFYDGKLSPKPQNEAEATLTKKFTTEDGFVDPSDLAAAEQGDTAQSVRLDRKIRALNPEPGVWTMRENKRLKLLEAKIENNKLRLVTTQREGEKAKSRNGSC
jgi:methionyl-tRNA formyltransferase